MAAAIDKDPANRQTNLASWPRIEWAPIESLRPNPKNPRTHSRKQIRQIVESIRKFGFLNPILVDNANMILAGHGRFEAAHLQGLTDIPIVRFGHLTEAQKRAYTIADNRIAEQGGWDRHLLSIELGELMHLPPTEGLDISVTGFEIHEIDLLVKDRAKPGSAPEDVAPRPPRHAITRPGDLWLLGGHRLLCGDAQKADDLGRLTGGARRRISEVHLELISRKSCKRCPRQRVTAVEGRQPEPGASIAGCGEGWNGPRSGGVGRRHGPPDASRLDPSLQRLGPEGLIDSWTEGPKQIVEAGPDREKDGVVRWRHIDLKRVIAERFGVDFNPRYVGKLLKTLGFSHISALPCHPAQDERIVEAFKNVWPAPSASGFRDRLLSVCVNVSGLEELPPARMEIGTLRSS